MTLQDAISKFIEDRDDDLVIVCRRGEWELIYKDDFPRYDMYDHITAGMVFGALRDVLTPQLLNDLTAKLS
jgi:hypothetical protein